MKDFYDLDDNELFCTPYELKQFAFSGHNPTIFSLKQWLESKTYDKYTVVKKEHAEELLSTVSNYETVLRKIKVTKIIDTMMQKIGTETEKKVYETFCKMREN
jgi:hypothetical protein